MCLCVYGCVCACARTTSDTCLPPPPPLSSPAPQVLAFLASLRDHLSTHLQHGDLLQLLASCLRQGSPRLQRVALLLLEYALPTAPLAMADAAFGTAGFPAPVSSSAAGAAGTLTASALLSVVADTLLPQPVAPGLSSATAAMGVAHPSGYGAGFAAATLRAQVRVRMGVVGAELCCALSPRCICPLAPSKLATCSRVAVCLCVSFPRSSCVTG
jgi:hypothetical protein